MRNSILLAFVILTILTSCRTSPVNLNDSYKSVNEPIQIIKNEIQAANFKFINIKIDNYHNGCFRLNSTVMNTDKGLSLSTRTINASGVQADTVILLTAIEFLDALTELQNTSRIVLAGTDQEITIEYSTSKETFNTREGYGLLFLLTEGKTNLVKK
jgi:hypothetical protein